METFTSALAGQGDTAREERQADDGQDQLDAQPLLLLHLPPLLFKGEGGELAPLKVGFLHGGGLGSDYHAGPEKKCLYTEDVGAKCTLGLKIRREWLPTRKNSH